MADIKTGEAFGLEPLLLQKIDWPLALKRVMHDLRSDFIYAPHLGYIYSKAGDELIAQIKSSLKAGKYLPDLPLTIEVPKSLGMKVVVANRRGPSFSRPGSILLPHDRLFYQALADQVAPIIEAKTDKKRSFSHRLAVPASASMFLPTRSCWNRLQEAIAEHSKAKEVSYILKVDVSNYFGSLNQHTLINTLNDSGYAKGYSSRLEALLTCFTGERSSRGILQGMYPSDLLGNYYLAPIDKFLNDKNVPSARYVDDLYIFVPSVASADQLLREFIPTLRSYDLVLNEAKSVIMPKGTLHSEEPDLEKLFSEAVDEIAEQLEEGEFLVGYGFQADWEEQEQPDHEELELEATKALFDSQPEYKNHEENIERFCLPLFTAAVSDHAVKHVLSAFDKRPAMAQIYSLYLSKFLENEDVRSRLLNALADPALTDWQRMWALAGLSQLEDASDDEVKIALDVLKDANRHDTLRAVASIFVGEFGDHARRKTLVGLYANATPYVKSAIYYSSRLWPGVEKANAKAAWGGYGVLNPLITTAMQNKQALP